MEFFNIPVTIEVEASSLEEAQIKAWLFMPWTNGSTWSINQHSELERGSIYAWEMEGVYSNDMEGYFRDKGLR